ncbi:MAG: ferrous iron transport protein B [Rikenellaceae bacterium]
MVGKRIIHKIASEEVTHKIDLVLTHKFWGIPIFFFFMFVIFGATFTLGVYPMGWIESGVAALSSYLESTMNEGVFKDLIIDGVVGGVGGVIIFLPNILILYLLISVMEDSGYMNRAASIMNKSMQRIGLHGKSFIPLVMGFGCNVPAIMASSTIESRNSRIITIFVNPFMSCSARLPLYILLVGTFFPQNSALIFFCLYLLGIVLAIVTALVMRKFLFKGKHEPFVVELTPYKLPSARAALFLMWDKAWQYLRKMGGLILIASIAVWFLSYYPHDGEKSAAEQQRNSYMGRIGVFCEPIMSPLGFEWKANVALISGVAAKELIVSTFGVLYSESDDDSSQSLQTKLTSIDPQSGRADFTSSSALAFMVFVLIYFPCIASLAAISSQTGSWKWAVASLTYSTLLAWVCAFIVFNIANLII